MTTMMSRAIVTKTCSRPLINPIAIPTTTNSMNDAQACVRQQSRKCHKIDNKSHYRCNGEELLGRSALFPGF